MCIRLAVPSRSPHAWTSQRPPHIRDGALYITWLRCLEASDFESSATLEPWRVSTVSWSPLAQFKATPTWQCRPPWKGPEAAGEPILAAHSCHRVLLSPVGILTTAYYRHCCILTTAYYHILVVSYLLPLRILAFHAFNHRLEVENRWWGVVLEIHKINCIYYGHLLL